MVKTSFSFVVVLLVLQNLVKSTVTEQEIDSKNRLLYIIMDGFRHDFLEKLPREELPGFNGFLDDGSRSDFVHPIFPSLSFPCLASLATGLYAESHGVVGNVIYDSVEKDVFGVDDEYLVGQKKWLRSEPIWTTVTNHGLKAVVLNLQGLCDISVQGLPPEYCVPYTDLSDSSDEALLREFQQNVGIAIENLINGADFIVLYTSYIDDIAHIYGPESSQLLQALRNIDAEIQRLLNKEEEFSLKDKVNIIITGDHGVRSSSIGTSVHLELDDFINSDNVEFIIDYSAVTMVKVVPGYLELVYEELQNMPGVDVYMRQEIPDELHFRENKYIYDILIKAHAGTYLLPSYSTKMVPPRGDFKLPPGDHGWWSREEEDMKTILFARGPDIKGNRNIIPPIEQVDIYPLLMHLLEVSPQPNNGSVDVIKKVLINERSISGATNKTVYVALIWIACILAIY